MEKPTEPMRISESTVRVILALATPPLLLAMALLTLSVGSPIAVPIVFGALGTLLGAVVVFDFPLAVEVNANGLVRVCLLRHHSLSWEEIAAIVKPRRRGLVLVTTNRKRHVLVDRILDPEERNRLLAEGERHDIQIGL
ncbi:MAG TPA: hypothetical protein VMO52_04505 [Acidimicrobiia bacterium]|nr:hypothetical protein [Acidimicrobiia bacterium]